MSVKIGENTPVLNVVVTDFWYGRIESGEKKKEYRIAKPFWLKRILKVAEPITSTEYKVKNGALIRIQKAYRKKTPYMIFMIKDVWIQKDSGDLNIGNVDTIVIQLGRRMK